MKPIPKSLHTVTALRRFAAFIIEDRNNGTLYEEAIDIAARELGYWDTPDTYGLKAIALKQLQELRA